MYNSFSIKFTQKKWFYWQFCHIRSDDVELQSEMEWIVHIVEHWMSTSYRNHGINMESWHEDMMYTCTICDPIWRTDADILHCSGLSTIIVLTFLKPIRNTNEELKEPLLHLMVPWRLISNIIIICWGVFRMCKADILMGTWKDTITSFQMTLRTNS